ncbi:molybdate ABC transporter substrate-binding protein [Nocardioides jishulii]|uniref:Molybdate ABC transporter substrate-binding protein n=1 Tax=Nocardioides jishulii TaxID=2575440 RepID=A0A4U2YRX3_9ACTN|nr:molybdate ABC transporter substrate-binding protein [Nocardioides jishulii]QCX28930.1 molybdate ABC transporter substrate-binding protein [Nocardioides jishulii]TKI64169.1 molybdate ABC transporter substrate-binding protein [Nocardioides jishulii]
MTSASTAARLRLLTVLLLLAVAPGCSQPAEGSTTLTVHAAASLRGPFEELVELFEEEHPDVTVRLNVAGSADLVAQVEEGAPADVVATADTATMERLAADGLVTDPTPFAANTLVIVVPRGNPADVAGLRDLAGDVDLVVCAPQVPCGAAAARVEEAAGVAFTPVSEEQSVTDVLGKVRAGEAEAGLVYVTDALSAGDHLEVIEFEEASEAVNVAPVAVASGSERPALARAFADLVTSPTGERVLTEAGFRRP